MTIEEELEAALYHYDRLTDDNLRAVARLLFRQGATDEEVDRELAIQAEEISRGRVDFRNKLHAWLLRGGESLQ